MKTNNNIIGSPQSPTLNFTLKDTQQVTCDQCGCKIFQEGTIFRKVSKLIAGTDKDALVPVNVPYCVDCKSPLMEILPLEIKHEFENLISS
jgi:hypothetical protein